MDTPPSPSTNCRLCLEGETVSDKAERRRRTRTRWWDKVIAQRSQQCEFPVSDTRVIIYRDIYCRQKTLVSFQQGASIIGQVVLKVRHLSVYWHFISLHRALWKTRTLQRWEIRQNKHQTSCHETHAMTFFPTSWSTTRFVWVDWNMLKALNTGKGNIEKNKRV